MRVPVCSSVFVCAVAVVIIVRQIVLLAMIQNLTILFAQRFACEFEQLAQITFQIFQWFLFATTFGIFQCFVDLSQLQQQEKKTIISIRSTTDNPNDGRFFFCTWVSYWRMDDSNSAMDDMFCQIEWLSASMSMLVHGNRTDTLHTNKKSTLCVMVIRCQSFFTQNFNLWSNYFGRNGKNANVRKCKQFDDEQISTECWEFSFWHFVSTLTTTLL